MKRLDMDIRYLRRRSLALDAHILFQTVLSVVSGKKF